MARKVRRRIVAMGAAAVAAVYGAGYLRTAPAAARIAAAERGYVPGQIDALGVSPGALALAMPLPDPSDLRPPPELSRSVPAAP